MTYSTVAPLLVALFPAQPADPPAVSASAALSRWEASQGTVDEPTLQGWVATIRANASRGDPIVGRLLRIIENSKHSPRSRIGALRLACELADEANAVRIVALMNAQIELLIKGRDKGMHFGSPDHSPVSILQIFLRDGADHLIGVLSDQRELLAVFKSCYLERVPVARRWAPQLIVACHVPPEEKRDAVVDIIREDVPVESELLALLDSEGVASLRSLVRNKTLDTFNWSAANPLSYLGDVDIAPDLKGYIPIFEAEGNYGVWLRRYLWRIELQHPPYRLLEFVASAKPCEQHEDPRRWAVRRAYELGVDPEQIREAILKHERAAKTPLARGEVNELKWTGMELGILHEGDLPGVKLGSIKIRR